jgi:hypothetical protein
VSALNLDGQLASRDELRVMEMAIRNDIAICVSAFERN